MEEMKRYTVRAYRGKLGADPNEAQDMPFAEFQCDAKAYAEIVLEELFQDLDTVAVTMWSNGPPRRLVSRGLQ